MAVYEAIAPVAVLLVEADARDRPRSADASVTALPLPGDRLSAGIARARMRRSGVRGAEDSNVDGGG